MPDSLSTLEDLLEPPATPAELGDNPEKTLKDEASKFGLKVTSGRRSRGEQLRLVRQGKTKARNSYHLFQGGAGALDFGGDPHQMRAFAEHMHSTYGPHLAELFHDPVGGFKNGQAIGAIGKHSNHVHVAWNPGRSAETGGLSLDDLLVGGEKGHPIGQETAQVSPNQAITSDKTPVKPPPYHPELTLEGLLGPSAGLSEPGPLPESAPEASVAPARGIQRIYEDAADVLGVGPRVHEARKADFGKQQADEQKFQDWYKERAGKLDLDPNPDDPRHFYDYRSAYAAGAEPDESGHWPSEFKSPDHPNRFVQIGGQTIDSITGQPTHIGAVAKKMSVSPEPKTRAELVERLNSINDQVKNLAPGGKLMGEAAAGVYQNFLKPEYERLSEKLKTLPIDAKSRGTIKQQVKGVKGEAVEHTQGHAPPTPGPVVKLPKDQMPHAPDEEMTVTGTPLTEAELYRDWFDAWKRGDIGHMKQVAEAYFKLFPSGEHQKWVIGSLRQFKDVDKQDAQQRGAGAYIPTQDIEKMRAAGMHDEQILKVLQDEIARQVGLSDSDVVQLTAKYGRHPFSQITETGTGAKSSVDSILRQGRSNAGLSEFSIEAETLRQTIGDEARRLYEPTKTGYESAVKSITGYGPKEFLESVAADPQISREGGAPLQLAAKYLSESPKAIRLVQDVTSGALSHASGVAQTAANIGDFLRHPFTTSSKLANELFTSGASRYASDRWRHTDRGEPGKPWDPFVLSEGKVVTLSALAGKLQDEADNIAQSRPGEPGSSDFVRKGTKMFADLLPIILVAELGGAATEAAISRATPAVAEGSELVPRAISGLQEELLSGTGWAARGVASAVERQLGTSLALATYGAAQKAHEGTKEAVLNAGLLAGPYAVMSRSGLGSVFREAVINRTGPMAEMAEQALAAGTTEEAINQAARFLTRKLIAQKLGLATELVTNAGQFMATAAAIKAAGEGKTLSRDEIIQQATIFAVLGGIPLLTGAAEIPAEIRGAKQAAETTLFGRSIPTEGGAIEPTGLTGREPVGRIGGMVGYEVAPGEEGPAPEAEPSAGRKAKGPGPITPGPYKTAMQRVEEGFEPEVTLADEEPVSRTTGKEKISDAKGTQIQQEGRPPDTTHQGERATGGQVAETRGVDSIRSGGKPEEGAAVKPQEAVKPGPNPKVIGHVAGPSGSGKTEIANALGKQVKNIALIDLDAFDDGAVKRLGWTKISKDDFTDEMLAQLHDEKQGIIDRFIEKSRKPIVFFGHHIEGDKALDLHVENKILLDVPARTAALRQLRRPGRTRERLSDYIKTGQEDIKQLAGLGYTPTAPRSVFSQIRGLSRDLSTKEGAIVSETPARVQGVQGAISRERQERRKAEQAATVDTLTGLQSQGQWLAARDRIEEDPNLSIARLDINGLKAVNDQHGHDAGDAYIQAAAKIIAEEASNAGIPSRLQFRSGRGDEFTLGGKRSDLDRAVKSIQERISREVGLPDGTKGSIAAGIGAKERIADSEMYKSKAAGRKAEERAAKLARAGILPKGLEGNATAPESVMKSAVGNTESLLDLANGSVFREQGLSGFDIPSQRVVMGKVLAAIHNDKVRGIVIKTVPVSVVDDLLRVESPTKVSLHNGAVLKDGLATGIRSTVSLRIDIADALVRILARLPAKGSAASPVDVFGVSGELSATVKAGTIDLRHGAVPPSPSTVSGAPSSKLGAPPTIPQARRQDQEVLSEAMSGSGHLHQGWQAAVTRIQGGDLSEGSLDDLRVLSTAIGLSDAAIGRIEQATRSQHAGEEGRKPEASEAQRPGRGEAVRGPRPPKSQVATGSQTKIRIPGQARSYQARYEIRELADAYPSHNPHNFQANPDYYHTNDRDYSDPVNSSRVIQAQQEFDPAYLLADTPTAVDGPPVLDADGNALSGNNRLMTIARVYRNDPARASEYRTALLRSAGKFGIDTRGFVRMKQPVLVRVLDDRSLETQQAITDLNVVGTAALTQAEQAIADARRLPAEMVDYLTAKIDAEGPEGTLAKVLEGSKGPQVVNHLIETGVFTPQERPKLIDSRGLVTQEAKSRISRLLIGRLFRDLDQLENTPQDIKNKLERIIAPLTQVAANPEWDITDIVNGAVDAIREQKARGFKNLEELSNQPSMFGGPEYSPAEIAVAKTLKESPTKVAKAFRSYANDEHDARIGQGSILGPPPDQEMSFRENFGMPVPEYTEFDAVLQEVAPRGLSTEQYDQVVAKLEGIKSAAKKSRQKLSTAIDDYLAQGSLFGQELSPEQQTLLRDLAARGRRAAQNDEQQSLFDIAPTVESREAARGEQPGFFPSGGLFEETDPLAGKVLAHVAGPSGAGKTEIANALGRIVKNIALIDIDALDDGAVKKLGWTGISKDDYTDEMLQRLHETTQKIIDAFIEKSKKPIVFFGHATEAGRTLNLHGGKKLLLDVPARTAGIRQLRRPGRDKGQLRKYIQTAEADIKELTEAGYTPTKPRGIFSQVRDWSRKPLEQTAPGGWQSAGGFTDKPTFQWRDRKGYLALNAPAMDALASIHGRQVFGLAVRSEVATRMAADAQQRAESTNDSEARAAFNGLAKALLDSAARRSEFAIVNTSQGARVRQSLRHELTHVAQLGLARFFRRQPPPTEFYNIPHFLDAAVGLISRGYEAGDPTVTAYEAAAHISAGQRASLGLNLREAHAFMKGFYDLMARTYRPDALTVFQDVIGDYRRLRDERIKQGTGETGKLRAGAFGTAGSRIRAVSEGGRQGIDEAPDRAGAEGRVYQEIKPQQQGWLWDAIREEFGLPKPETEKATARDPAQMTREEFGKAFKPTRNFQKFTSEQRSELGASHRAGFRQKEQVGEFFYTTDFVPDRAFDTAAKAKDAGHRAVVERALAEGKTVRAEVLADYPDLTRAAPHPVTKKQIESWKSTNQPAVESLTQIVKSLGATNPATRVNQIISDLLAKDPAAKPPSEPELLRLATATFQEPPGTKSASYKPTTGIISPDQLAALESSIDSMSEAEKAAAAKRLDEQDELMAAAGEKLAADCNQERIYKPTPIK